MRVVFTKAKHGHCMWTARPKGRRPITGSGGHQGQTTVPHDLLQFVVEREHGYRYGFWGCMADGATFRSLADRHGRGKVTPHGRAIIAAHVHELNEAEHAANTAFADLRDRVETPLTTTLAQVGDQWTALPEGASLELVFDPLVAVPPRHAAPRTRARR